MKLYVDMDGTLCRFHDVGHAYEERMWEPGFYRELKPFAALLEGLQLFEERHPETEIYILSAILPTEPPFIEEEKRAWLREHYPSIPDERMNFVPAGGDKAAFLPQIDAQCVLLDDYNKNLLEWQAAGGMPIKFRNDVNNRGLGAYGGEKGPIWAGAMLHHDSAPVQICTNLEALTGVVQDRDLRQEEAEAGKLLPYLSTYFDLRKSVDARMAPKMAAAARDSYMRSNVSEPQTKMSHQQRELQDFFAQHDFSPAYQACFATCYLLAKAHDIPAGKLRGWMQASYQAGQWRDAACTVASLRRYIPQMAFRDVQLKAAAASMRSYRQDLRRIQSMLYTPAFTATEPEQLDALRVQEQSIQSDIRGLQTQWRNLTGVSYPKVCFGHMQMKFDDYLRQDRQPCPER